MSFPSSSGSDAFWSDLGSRQLDVPSFALNKDVANLCRDVSGEYPDLSVAETELNYASSSTLPMKNMPNSVTSAKDPVAGVEIFSKPQQRNTGRRDYAEENDWELHREAISRMYKEMKLKDVRAFMETVHRFFATEKMYKDRLRKWGVQKNVTAKRVQGALQRAQGSKHSSPIPSPAVADDALDNTQIEKYIRRRSAGLGKLSPEDQRLARDLFTPDESKCAHSNERCSSDKRHPAASQAARGIAFLEQPLQDTNHAEAQVSRTQDAQQFTHGFSVNQSSAHPLVPSGPFDNHQELPYSGITQLDMREGLYSGFSSVYQSNLSGVGNDGLVTGKSWTQPQSSVYAGAPTALWTGTSLVQIPEEPQRLYRELNQYG